MEKLNYYFKLLRPKHWVKNLLVFIALVFAFKFDQASFSKILLTFGAFCLFASSIYIINDIFDAKSDRLHPKKKNRPIAAGRVGIFEAFVLFSLLLTGGFFLSTAVSINVWAICLAYFVINIFYSLGLKNFPIVDVMIIALGFVLRVVVGAFAIGVAVSHWLLLCTFFLSLFLAFGKRKNEMDILGEDNKNGHRKSIAEYTDGFISQMLALTAGISVVFYSLYTIDPETVVRFKTDNLIYTTPLVIFGVFRYFHLLYNKRDGGDPVQLIIDDWQLKLDLVVWVAAVTALYFINQ